MVWTAMSDGSAVVREAEATYEHSGDLSTAPVVTLVPGLPANDLDRRLRHAHRNSDVGNRELAFYLADMELRRLHQLLGFGSTLHYAMSRLDLTRTRAQQLLQCGKALEGLKLIDQAFNEGSLVWSRVRLLVQIATPDTESNWLDAAKSKSWSDFERAVKTSRKGQKPRKDSLGLPEVRVNIQGFVDPLTHEVWQKAKARLQAERGETVTDGQAMKAMAWLFLSTRPDGSLPGREPEPEAVFRVLLQSCPTCQEAKIATEDGLIPLGRQPELSRSSGIELIDAEDAARKTPLALKSDGLSPVTPAWMRDLVLARDGYRCRNCKAGLDLQAHHIVWRSQGGATSPENLLSTCATCHALIHAGLLDVRGLAQDVKLADREGRPLERLFDPLLPTVVLAEPKATAVAPTVDATAVAPTVDAPLSGKEVLFESFSSAGDVPWWRRHVHLFSWNDRRGVLDFRSGFPTSKTDAYPEVGQPGPAQASHRPSTLDQILGQDRTVHVLRIAAEAARKNGRAASHVLLSGAPGLGKTSLAHAYAQAIGTRAHLASGPQIKDPGALLTLLAGLGPREVLFIDEIHALPVRVAESLYEAVEDGCLSFVVTDGTRSRTLRITLEPFTLVGATTAPAQIPAPLSMRFPLKESLEFYEPEALATIVKTAAEGQGLELDRMAALLLAKAGRDTPREALALLVRVRNAADAEGITRIEAPFVAQRLKECGIGADGQNPVDRKLVAILRRNGRGRPMGLQPLAACLGTSPRTLREMHEPFLLRRGLLATTPRGRIALEDALPNES